MTSTIDTSNAIITSENDIHTWMTTDKLVYHIFVETISILRIRHVQLNIETKLRKPRITDDARHNAVHIKVRQNNNLLARNTGFMQALTKDINVFKLAMLGIIHLG